jgi:membrane-associated protease RseP (regulator of RpoE activity)
MPYARRSVFRRYCLPALLLCASVVTTTANGARFMFNFEEGLQPLVRDSDLWPWPWLARHPHMFSGGFAFSLTLLGILLVHEFGHYIACRLHGIDATLPWVLPAPTLSGTAGAVIRIRSRIPTKDALMDVGVYGPLAGYVASAAAIAAGFLLSDAAPRRGPIPIVRFGGEPLTIRMVHSLLLRWNPAIPAFNRLIPHPVLIAGWIGLFITSLNLIPGGQLDGGHILFAFSSRLHRVLTGVLPMVLILAGLYYWAGWVLWGLILLFPAMRHPPVVYAKPLSRSRVALGLIGLGILLCTFTPTPFYGDSLLHLLNMGPVSSVR